MATPRDYWLCHWKNFGLRNADCGFCFTPIIKLGNLRATVNPNSEIRIPQFSNFELYSDAVIEFA
jgi:hypothetical protein